jgi:hypothetical protein
MKIRKKRCKQCSKQFVPFNSLQRVCSVGCAIELTKQIKKENDATIDLLVKKKKERIALGTILGYTKTRVHQYIRLRDKGKPCISCGTEWKDDFQAGHFFSAGKYTSIKFDVHNINGQCVQCNLYKEGNFDAYSLNLPNRIGIANYNKLVKRAKNSVKTIKKYNREELKEIQNEIKRKTKELPI